LKEPWKTTAPISVISTRARGQASDYTRFTLPGGGRYQLSIRVPHGTEMVSEIDVPENAIFLHEIHDKPNSPEKRRGSPIPVGKQVGTDKQISLARPPTLQPPGLPALREPANLPAPYYTSLGNGSFMSIFSEYAQADTSQVIPHPSVIAGHLDPSSLPVQTSKFWTWDPPMPRDDEHYRLIEELRIGSYLGWAVPESSDQRYPRWLTFQTERSVDFVSVPWSWWGADERERGEGIRLRQRRLSTPRQKAIAPTVTLTDHRWGALLEFVAAGRLGEAVTIVSGMDRQEPMLALYGKLRSPLAAVLGGLVLVGAEETGRETEWDAWVKNLADWFPGLPDGSILLGYRQLQLGLFQEGGTQLREAVRRGIPYFAASVRMLLLGLAQLQDDETVRVVSKIASKVDPTQAFTVISERPY